MAFQDGSRAGAAATVPLNILLLSSSPTAARLTDGAFETRHCSQIQGCSSACCSAVQLCVFQGQTRGDVAAGARPGPLAGSLSETRGCREAGLRLLPLSRGCGAAQVEAVRRGRAALPAHPRPEAAVETAGGAGAACAVGAAGPEALPSPGENDRRSGGDLLGPVPGCSRRFWVWQRSMKAAAAAASRAAGRSAPSE